jgi:uncharacterized protein (DUF58 family)
VNLPVPSSLGWKGLLFHALLVGAFYAAPYANLFFLLLAFLTLFGALDFIWAHRNLAGVNGAVNPSAPAPAGTEPEIKGWLEAGARARYGVSVRLDLAGRDPVEIHTPEVRGRIGVAGAGPALERGIYPVRNTEITSCWPLGLFRSRRSIQGPDEFVVYPAPACLSEAREGDGPLGEIPALLGAPSGALQPSGLREFRPGDPVKRIHWKASARRGDLVMQEWESGTGAGYEVVLDRRTSPESLEESLSIVSAMALAAREEKEVLTLHTQGLSASYGASQRAWPDLFRFLAGATALPAGSAPPPPAGPAVPRLPVAGGGRA